MIARVEAAAREQARLQHPEVVGRHRAVADYDVAVRQRPVFDVHGKIELTEARGAHHGNGFDAGRRCDAFERLLHERPLTLRRQRKPHDEQAVWIVSAFNPQHAHEALRQQARTGKQDDGARELTGHEPSVDPVLPPR